MELSSWLEKVQWMPFGTIEHPTARQEFHKETQRWSAGVKLRDDEVFENH